MDNEQTQGDLPISGATNEPTQDAGQPVAQDGVGSADLPGGGDSGDGTGVDSGGGDSADAAGGDGVEAGAGLDTNDQTPTADSSPAGEVIDQAKADHDAWCAAQIADGWAYGAEYSEQDRRDPRLVHFDLLPKG